jgi:hypothetical protein
MTPEEVSTLVTREARERALAGLLRRRPDVRSGAKGIVEVPDDELARVQLDQLAYTSEALARLHEVVTSMVVAARAEGASWAKVGLALQESAQTAFNRYRHVDPAGTVAEASSGNRKRSRRTEPRPTRAKRPSRRRSA